MHFRPLDTDLLLRPTFQLCGLLLPGTSDRSGTVTSVLILPPCDAMIFLSVEKQTHPGHTCYLQLLMRQNFISDVESVIEKALSLPAMEVRFQ